MIPTVILVVPIAVVFTIGDVVFVCVGHQIAHAHAIVRSDKIHTARLHRVCKLIGRARNPRGKFRDHARNRGGEISFLALHSLTVTFLPGWLMRLKAVAGQMTSRVKPENFDRCIASLTRNRCTVSAASKPLSIRAR
mgnify:CR=1 FL=1